jgi:putative serine protease PepD
MQPAPSGGMGVRRGVIAGVAALAIALTAGGVGGFVGYALHPDGSPLQVPASTGNGNAAPVIDRSSLASIAAALQPAIVDITTSAGEGSGVVISADGNIVTNNHVVEGARGNSVKVTFNSGKQIAANGCRHRSSYRPRSDQSGRERSELRQVGQQRFGPGR